MKNWNQELSNKTAFYHCPLNCRSNFKILSRPRAAVWKQGWCQPWPLWVAAGAGAAAAGQGVDGILGQQPPQRCWCYGLRRCELVPGAQSPWETPTLPNPWGRQWCLQPLTTHLESSSLQKRWAQRMNFQGASGSGWFSTKHYWDKDHDQIIPGNCTKARKKHTLVQIAFFGYYQCFLSGSLGAAFFSHFCTVWVDVWDCKKSFLFGMSFICLFKIFFHVLLFLESLCLIFLIM